MVAHVEVHLEGYSYCHLALLKAERDFEEIIKERQKILELQSAGV